MRASPLVTVVVPSFNEDPHIVRTSLESIRAQTFTDFECIVVDESTRPELAEACRAVCAEDPRFIYVHPTERLGLPKSLNLGIGQAKGELIARFDSDDVCAPERLAKQVAYMEAHPEVHVLGSALRIISNTGQVLGLRSYPLRHEDIAKRMQITNAVGHPSLLIRKSSYTQWGGYDPDFRFSEDLDLWLRWLNAGARFANLDEPLIDYRQEFTFRNKSHWDHNLRARRKNWSSQHLLHRVAGFLTVACWRLIPNRIQESVYRQKMLRMTTSGTSR
jgi:glycosyltransferase involved in cell wall biosynthesis